MVFDPPKLRKAPLEDAPVPEIVMLSPIVTPPDTCRVAPLVTVVEPAVVPNAEACDTANVPADTDVAPLNELFPDNVSVPEPALVTPPVPEITPENAVFEPSPPAVNVAEPNVTEPAPAIEPTTSDTPFKSNVPAIDIAEPSGTPPDDANTSEPADTNVEPV
jgi:hypothetical protein